MANEQSNPQAKPQPQAIPLAKIRDLPGVFFPKQPDKSYGGLVTSIQANGVKEAVILRLREDGEYQLVEGYRRRRASELAKKPDIPAYVYEMTLQEAIAYRKQAKVQTNVPIPGKLVEAPSKAADAPAKSGPAPAVGEKPKEQAVPGKEEKDKSAEPKTENKPEKSTVPGERPKDGDKPGDPAKAVSAPAKEETPTVAAAGPTAPGKEDKDKTSDPKAEDKPEKSTIPGEKSKDGDKPSDPAKAVIPPAKEEKPIVAAAGPAAPGKEDKDKSAAPKAEDKPEKSAVPGEKPKDGDKPGDPAKAVIPPAKEEKPAVAAAGPAAPGKDDKDKSAAPKAEDKPEKSAAPGEKAKDGDKPDDPAKTVIPPAKEEKPTVAAAAPAAPGKEDKATAPKAEDKPEKSTKVVDFPAPAGKSAPAVTGPAASGPAGTAITQIFDKRLDPPNEKALKSLPVPGEGESFFITLHPAYLQKSKFNTFSVDTSSENYKELRKSVELVGIKDPVLTRINPEGGLEILSGQRRHLAATELNYSVPAIIQKIDDADAKIIVADGNLHRDKISTYDLSRALRMKMEGMKQKSGRRKKGEFKAEELDSDEKLAREMGMSVSKLNRIIRLSEASKDVCDRVDDGSLALSIASAISFLKPANQDEVLHLADLGYKVTNDRVERMKKVEKSGKLDESKMRDILEDKDIAPKQTVPPAPAPSTPAAAPTAAPTTPPAAPTATGPTTIPASPDIKPAVAANDVTQISPTAAAPSTPEPPAAEKSPEKETDVFKGAQERPENTKVILTGDRLRRYFPDVSMTPREIEESIYEALEERRQRQMKMQQKKEIFQKNGPTR